MSRRVEMAGSIVSTGFYSGDRVVVGRWARSPIGSLVDVMWADPEGFRTLYVPSDDAADFVSGVYEFDHVIVTPFTVEASAHGIGLTFADRELELEARSWGWRIPLRGRPPWFTRWVEGPIARLTMGVRTFGTSPTGVREWYRADRYRPLVSASGSVAGQSLGSMERVEPAVGFGFSEPPAHPSWVDVRPLLEYPR